MRRRTVDIIRELLVDNGATLSELARRFDVSERTIRSDVSTINDLLYSASMQLLDYGPGGKILVPEGFGRIHAQLLAQAKETYHLSKQERCLLASFMLVDAVDHVTMSSLADRLSASRTTIMNDVDSIRDMLAKGYLTLVSQPGHGLIVKGEEAEKRNYLLHAMLSATGIPKVADILSNGSPQAGDDAIVIRKVLNEQDRTHNVTMTDEAFERMVGYLCIAVHRMRMGRGLRGGSTPLEATSQRGAFCADVLRLVGQYCAVDVNDAERDYLEGAISSINLQIGNEFSIDDLKVQVLCRKLIDHVSKSIGVDLNGDYDLFEYLSNHLSSMFVVEPPSFTITNDIKKVVNEYPDVLRAVSENERVLEEYGSRPISGIELDYICIHFCAALERRKSRESNLRIIVACNVGIGTSQLLAENLRGRFSFRIIRVIPSHEATLLKRDDADLVISTVPLEGCPIDSVVFSVYPSETECARIQRHIDRIRNSLNSRNRVKFVEHGTQGLIEVVSSVVRQDAPELSAVLVPKIASAIKGYFSETVQLEQEILQPFLHQLLPASHIQLDVLCVNWKDAIARSAEPLVKMGYIEPRYVGAMIDNVEQNGPYIVLSDGFAMPHAAADEGAMKMGMSLIRLSEPVCFGEEEYDPIDLVCCLSTTDSKSHLRAFFNLVNLLRESRFKAALRTAESSEETARVIQLFERRLES